MVLKRDNERIVQDVIKSLAGRKEDLTVEVYMCDPITLLLLPKPLRSSFALVKEYSENEGVAKALEDAGILKRMCTIPIGFGYGYLCQINERMLK